MALNRRTPTPGNPTVQPGGSYADDVNEEVAALWNGVGLFVDNVSGTGNAITGTVTPALDAWQKGQYYYYKPLLANAAGPMTLDLGRGAKSVVTNTGQTPAEGAFAPGAIYPLVYDGTVLRQIGTPGVQGPAGAPGGTTTALNLAALQALTLSAGAFVQLLGRDEEGDGCGGRFVGRTVDLSGTLIGAEFTTTSVDSGTDIFTSAGIGLIGRTGMQCIVSAAVNGLSTNTKYWFKRLSDNTGKLAASRADLDAAPYVPVNLTGTTNFTIRFLADPDQGVYVIPSGDALDGSDGAWVRVSLASPKLPWFGGKPGGAYDGGLPGFSGTDNVPAMRALLNYCYFTRQTAFIPGGDWTMGRMDGHAAVTGEIPVQVQVPSWVRIRGTGRLLIDHEVFEALSGHKNQITFASPDPYAAVTVLNETRKWEMFDIEGIQTLGLLENHADLHRITAGPTFVLAYRTVTFHIRNTAWLRMDDCESDYSSGPWSHNFFNDEAQFTGLRIYHCASVSTRNSGGSRSTWDNCRFRWTNDDCVDCMSQDNTETGHTRHIVTVTNCKFEDAIAIDLFGIRHGEICNNTFKRCGRNITIAGNDGTEGRGSYGGVVVAGNTIEDPLGFVDVDWDGTVKTAPTSFITASDFHAAIHVAGGKITNENATGSAYPGFWRSGAGFFLDDWAHMGASHPKFGAMHVSNWETQTVGAETFPGQANAGGHGLSIAGNIIRRTLPDHDVSDVRLVYEDWGFGQYWTRSGFCNPEIDPAKAFKPHAIVISGAISDFHVVANQMKGFRYGAGVYYFIDASAHDAAMLDYQYRRGLVAGNIVTDCRYGVATNVRGGGTTYKVDIRHQGNIIDNDPLIKQATYRVNGPPATGAWASNSIATDACFGADLRGLQGWTWERNSHRNCIRPIMAASAFEEVNMIEGNLVECELTEIGDNAANLGIRNTPEPGRAWRYRMIEGSPSSATYGHVVSECLLQSTTVPGASAGVYPRGWFVEKSNKGAISPANRMLKGWVKTATGAGATNWQVVYDATA